MGLLDQYGQPTPEVENEEGLVARLAAGARGGLSDAAYNRVLEEAGVLESMPWQTLQKARAVSDVASGMMFGAPGTTFPMGAVMSQKVIRDAGKLRTPTFEEARALVKTEPYSLTRAMRQRLAQAPRAMGPQEQPVPPQQAQMPRRPPVGQMAAQQAPQGPQQMSLPRQMMPMSPEQEMLSQWQRANSLQWTNPTEDYSWLSLISRAGR